MNDRVRGIIVFLILTTIFFGGGFIGVPRVLGALPGEYRVRLARIPLMEQLLDIGTTPLATALPAPSIVAERQQIAIPAFIPASATPTLETTATRDLVETIATNVNAFPTTTATPSPSPSPTATATPIPLPTQSRIVGLEIIPQGFNNCGPANLTINLNFYGEVTTQDEAAAFLKPNREDRNVSPWQLSDYVNEHTLLRSTVHSGGDLELIKRFVANGFPIVIEKGYEPTPSEGWLGHYFTVFGYDDEKQELTGMDTFLGPWDNSGRTESYETVEYYWQQFNYTFYVVYPPEQEPTIQGILGPDQLDPMSMWQKAAEQARVELEADSENAFAWFNMGTSLTRMGELSGETDFYEQGAASFDQARFLGIPPRIVWYQFRPYVAYMKVGRHQDMIDLAEATLSTQGGRNVEETYFYKGHALALQGKTQEALGAYERALRLNENFYPAQWAIDSLAAG